MNKFLMLGKEMTRDIVKVYNDPCFRDVEMESISDTAFKAMGKKLYDNKEMFLDYTKRQYEEDFDWKESSLNSFDFVKNLVGEFLCKKGGNHYWDEEFEVYIPKESLCYTVDSLNKKGYKDNFKMEFNDKGTRVVLTITLDEENNDNIEITSYCNSKFVIKHNNKSFNTNNIFDSLVIEDIEDYEKFINNLLSLLDIYIRIYDYRKLSAEELGLKMWKYISDREEYKFILENENLDENTSFLSDISKALVSNSIVAKDLALYYEGVIDTVSDNVYSEIKKCVQASISNNIQSVVWDRQIKQWVHVNLSSIEDCEKAISDRVEYFLKEDNLELPGVLSKDIELEILRDYSTNFLAKLIEFADERDFSSNINEYLLEKVDKYYDIFLKEGTLKRLSDSDIEIIYKKALMGRFEDSIDTINKKIFMGYISSILIFKGFYCNDDYKIAVYSALLNHVSELEASLDNLIEGGFSLSKIEDTLYYIYEAMNMYNKKTGKNIKPSSGKAIAELIDSLFIDWLSKK